MKFKRPIWRDRSNYDWLNGSYQGHFIAWEFLRRNPEYQADTEVFLAWVAAWVCRDNVQETEKTIERFTSNENEFFSAMNNYVDGFPEGFNNWNGHYEITWKLNRCYMTIEDASGEEFVIDAYDHPELFKPIDLIGGRVDQPRIMIPVDLSEPLEELERRVMLTIKRFRDMGVKSGAFVVRNSRVLATNLYIEQLRILDAVEDGASYSEIGQVIAPTQANHSESRQRDKRIRAAHAAALKMQHDGYRALLSNC